jgi:predicted lipid-binding transport protein (Tim44 family)
MLVIDILIFAAIAFFFFHRYKSVLGQPPERDVTPRREHPEHKDNVITLARDKIREVVPQEITPNAPVSQATLFAQMQRIDGNFSEKSFLQGAKTAFSLIVNAFATGDKETLKPLLNNETFKSFEHVIDQRVRDNHTVEFSVERLLEATIIKPTLDKSLATIIVEFLSEQVSVVRNAAGDVVEGDDERLVDVRDRWTFQRDLKNSDPTWVLIRAEQPSA